MIAKLMEYRQYLSFFLAFFELLKELIKEVEEEGPEEGGGEEKKEIVMDMVEVAYDFLDDIDIDLPISRDKILKIADNLIDSVVKFYNIVNIFK